MKKFLSKLRNYTTSRKGARAGVLASLVAVVSLAVPELVLAGGTNTDFDTAVTLIQEWAEGSLGKLVAITFLVVGIVMGVMRQSIFAAVPAIACALAMTMGPGIVQTMFAGTL